MNFNVEVYTENEQMYVYIGTENGSGAKYPIEGDWEIGEIIQKWVNTYQYYEEKYV